MNLDIKVRKLGKEFPKGLFEIDFMFDRSQGF